MTPESQPAQGDTLAAVVAELRRGDLTPANRADDHDLADRLEKLAAVPVGVTEQRVELLEEKLHALILALPSTRELLIAREDALAALAQPSGAGKCTITRSADPTTPEYMAVGTLNSPIQERCD